RRRERPRGDEAPGVCGADARARSSLSWRNDRQRQALAATWIDWPGAAGLADSRDGARRRSLGDDLVRRRIRARHPLRARVGRDAARLAAALRLAESAERPRAAANRR